MYINQCDESRGQEGPRHIGKRKEEQCSSSKGVDGPKRRECKEEVNETKAPRSPQCLVVAKAGFCKDCRGVESDDVDTAHLLGNHDCERGKGRAANTRNGEELDKSSYIITFSDYGRLNLELFVDVI